MKIPKESICPKWGLHAYQSILENSEVLVEVCLKCGERAVYNKVNSRIDERDYARRNVRMALQPFGGMKRDFEREYGKLGNKYAKRIIQAGGTLLDDFR